MKIDVEPYISWLSLSLTLSLSFSDTRAAVLCERAAATVIPNKRVSCVCELCAKRRVL